MRPWPRRVDDRGRPWRFVEGSLLRAIRGGVVRGRLPGWWHRGGADASGRDGEGRSARDLWWHRGHGHSGRTPTEDFHRIRELLRVAEPG